MEKIIIAAVSENGVIGKEGEIPWHHPEDLERFRELTTGHPVVMGRKTFESLPEDFRPLPERRNIVLTRSGFEHEGVETASSLEEAYSLAEGSEKLFIIGGESVYNEAMDDADRIELTRVHEEYDGDTYFPDISEDDWEETSRNDKGDISFVTYSSA